MCKGSQGGRLAQCVNQPENLVNCGQSINFVTFSTQDLREQGHKSYVAMQLLGEQRIGDPANDEGDSQKFSFADDSQ